VKAGDTYSYHRALVGYCAKTAEIRPVSLFVSEELTVFIIRAMITLMMEAVV
jgi:hypothetical protein